MPHARLSLPRLGRWPRLVLAGLCLVLAAASATSARGAPRTTTRTVAVVVAARDVPAGHRLASGDLAVARWPAAVVPHGALRAARDVLGRRSAGSVRRGEALTDVRLVDHDLTAGLAPGVLAVPVTVAGARTADLLRPGDRVELVATGRDETSDGADTDGTDSTEGTAGSDSAAGTGSASTTVTVVASRLLVVSVSAGRDGTGTDLVVAADRATALRIIRVAASQVLAAVGDSP